MIIFLVACYIALLAVFVWLKFIRLNLFWKISPIIVLLLLNIGLFIPMTWGAPQGSALVVRHSVAIVPDVAGTVLEVPVEPNRPLKAGDVLFRIDPRPFEAQVRAIAAQLRLQETRLTQMTQLHSTGTGRTFDVEQRQAEVDQLKAQLDGANWNLEKTVVRAPAVGFVTNVALRKGARVSNLPLAPAMAFIDTSETIIGVEVPQINARYVRVGQPIEVTFKLRPGKIYTGRVEMILPAIATGQTQVSGSATMPTAIQAAPFAIRVRLDDTDFASRLPAGATGTAAIFTDHVRVAHVIRRVVLRQIAILNYINPF
jgi:RND family efflux transporter MFP subunit